MSRRASDLSPDEWGERKWYLVHNLFTSVSASSPILKTEEQSLEPLSPTMADIIRVDSPLPDLIIEKEPNRHDDPEEFYLALERKIKEFYRELFIDTEKSSEVTEPDNVDKNSLDSDRLSQIEPAIINSDTTSQTQPATINSGRITSTNLATYTKSERSIDQNFYNCENIDEPINFPSEKTLTAHEGQQSDAGESNEMLSSTAKSFNSLLENTTTSSESSNNEIITTQAQIHRTGNEEIDIHTDYISACILQTSSSGLRNYSKTVITTVAPTEADASDKQSGQEHDSTNNSKISKNNRNFASLMDIEESTSETRYFSFTTDIPSLPEEPEIMRQQETRKDSVGSIPGLNVARYSSTDCIITKSVEVTSPREMEEASNLSSELSIVLNSSSNCKVLNKTAKSSQFKQQKTKRRVLSEISIDQNSPSIKQKKFDELSTQTSFSLSHDDNDEEDIPNNIFVTNLVKARLCYCANHLCHC